MNTLSLKRISSNQYRTNTLSLKRSNSIRRQTDLKPNSQFLKDSGTSVTMSCTAKGFDVCADEMEIIKEKMDEEPMTHDLSNEYPELSDMESDIDFLDCSSESDSESISFQHLFSIMSQVDEDLILHENGYKKVEILGKTLQGSLLKVQQIDGDKFFAVKKTDKILYENSICIDDEIETNFCVNEDIVKEAKILKHLSVDNKSIDDSIIGFVDFLESETDYYLVTEYCESEMNLKQFVEIAHQRISENKLDLKKYIKTIKNIFWQLVVTVNWLHNDMNCAHLDLCMENIMLRDCDFVEKKGKFSINKNISVKLIDFGVSEIFKEGSSFMCTKTPLSLENELFAAPKVFAEDTYNAHKADMFAIGHMLFQCLAGRPLHLPSEVMDREQREVGTGYWALYTNQFKTYLAMNNLLRFGFNSRCITLLGGLLNVDSDKRYSVSAALKTEWFHSFQKNCKYIEEKSVAQKEELLRQKDSMKQFPYYFK